MKFSKKKNSPIYTPNTDSDPMDRFSAIQDIENQYIKFYYSEKKLKYIILYNDPFHSFKSDYAINAILIPETYNRAEKIKNSEFIIKKNTKSYLDLKEARVKEQFLGGEVIESNFKITEGTKEYHFFRGWISKDNLIPLNELENQISNMS
ncbi:MAG: hypothetical protein SH817_02025 [Leptospira sp.]|nr:hypothetical protein [Leptospira sp.]